MLYIVVHRLGICPFFCKGTLYYGEIVKMAELGKIGDILVLIGALIGLIQGILVFIPDLGFGLGLIAWGDFGWLAGVCAILFSLIALVNSGFLKIAILDFGKKNKFIVVLIIGILMIVFGGDFGGLLVLIGAILWLL